MGGPRRDPTVRDMYTLLSARIDPTISISGNVGGGGDTRSNRLAVGEVASQLGLGMIHTATSSSKMPLLDVSLSSFAGTESPTNEEWNAEFERVLANMKSTTNSGSGGRLLFSADFSSVPSTKVWPIGLLPSGHLPYYVRMILPVHELVHVPCMQSKRVMMKRRLRLYGKSW